MPLVPSEAMFQRQLKLAINAPKDGRGISQKQVLEQNSSLERPRMGEPVIRSDGAVPKRQFLDSTWTYIGREVHGCIVLTKV